MKYLDDFTTDWYCIVDLDKDSFLNLEKIMDRNIEIDNVVYEKIHDFIDVDSLNEKRLSVIHNINKTSELRESVFDSVKNYLYNIVGNELAVQRKVNLSIQLPGDNSSLLPAHSDVWAGNSPYEVVVWIPFVDVQKSQSFFILPKEKSLEVYKEAKVSKKSIEDIYRREEKNFIWPKLKKGQALLFSHSLIHGNTVNELPCSRVSINLRFKSLMSPYSSKGLGEYFVPLNIKAATQIGLDIGQFYD